VCEEITVDKSRFAKRFNFDVSCQMDFHKYPVDKQTCVIHFESFSLTDKEVRFTYSNILIISLSNYLIVCSKIININYLY